MKKDHAVGAISKVWFQNRSLRYTETEGDKRSGILIP